MLSTGMMPSRHSLTRNIEFGHEIYQFGTHVFGLFCNGSTKYAQELRPWRATRGTPIFRAARVQLTNPELGDTNNPRNLWPQPYISTTWNAQLKDALETHLHELVCEDRSVALIIIWRKYLGAIWRKLLTRVSDLFIQNV